MPKKARELSALAVKRLHQPGLHAVGGVAGLHLLVKATGARSWILRTVVGSRRPDIGLGGYPDVTLEQARDKAREAKAQILAGTDPVAARRAARDALRAAQAKALTFDEAAKRCHRARSQEFRNRKHAKQWLATLDQYASPIIGQLPIAAVELPNVLQVLEPIWTSKTETATRVRQRIEAVLAWATVNGYREGPNPAEWKGSLEHALPKAQKVKRVTHHPALPFGEVAAFVAGLRQHKGIGARALEFAILTAARSQEVRHATWDEIDLKARMWTIPAHRMKAGKVHRVPLSDDAVKLLKALPRLADCALLFPSNGCKALSDNTLSKLLRDMDAGVVPHGFRSTFKDWARNCTRYSDEVSELALAHVNSDATRAAYARDELLAQRARLMQEWGRYIRTVPKKGTKVVPLRRART